MSITNMSIHGVVGVTVERTAYDEVRCLTITLRTADGSTISVDVFSAEPLALVDVQERRVTNKAPT